ncbi:dTDP-4-dehydrorhamnose 3,5-epimerase family protein [Haloglomus salinum]|uniref:dTDP-4-dehydrorhamnose 3,5-epimerase family protein n=1 Tax=Haloglomus salinum TaxID=2962673 RepID=UPI0020C93D1A|nr:dTDP-4-dehydrorhamnose 3,5-epimerase family protein [Haloglomus salinum]
MSGIEGVRERELEPIVDERGWLMEILRSDWPEFEAFGQVYLTTARPGVVKAWHEHEAQRDNFVPVSGRIKLVLADTRADSPTEGEIVEYFIGERNFRLVSIPPGVTHGFKCISDDEAMVVNVPTTTYDYEDPDEIRYDPDTDAIDYDWVLPDDRVHG